MWIGGFTLALSVFKAASPIGHSKMVDKHRLVRNIGVIKVKIVRPIKIFCTVIALTVWASVESGQSLYSQLGVLSSESV